MKITPIIKKEIDEIMKIKYFAPHALKLGSKPIAGDRCGDCFCTDQSFHTHTEDWYLELREKILSFIERL